MWGVGKPRTSPQTKPYYKGERWRGWGQVIIGNQFKRGGRSGGESGQKPNRL